MRKLLKILLFGATCCCLHQAQAQSTIFTYQGRLTANGAPANGVYDFRFTIYKVETNGLVIAGPLTNTAVAVSDGLFMVPLDFGQQPFLGVNRYLDIAVRTNGSGGAFTPLFPRERIASAPYAIAAANVIDGAVTASSLSPGSGPDGQVLKMSAGVLTWAPEVASGGTVTSVGTGTGLLGGPITSNGTVAINPAVVPLLNGNQAFAGSNTFSGVSLLTNLNNRFVGVFTGNGAGLSNITATATNSVVTMAGDVTGPSSAATVARLRGANVLATPPTANQVLRYSGTDWTPGAVALATDVSGTLADARLSANVPLLNGNQLFSGSNSFTGVASLANFNNKFVGAFTGNGSNLTALSAANISAGTLADARLSANVPLLNGNQTFGGSNTFNGVSAMTNVNNRFVGLFTGNGAGLSNITATSTNSVVTMAGDVTGSSSAATVARLRGVNVLATPPTANQLLRYSGTDWSPGAVALATDVSGTLADARLSANVALLNGNQTFAGSNTFNGIASLTNINNRFVGTFTGNGSNLTTLSAANISAGTMADARLSANVSLLNGNQIFTGSNTFNGVSALTNINNRFIGAFTGNGAGLSNITATATNSVVTLAGDVTGQSSAATVARLRGVNVLATAPAANQVLRFSGTDWASAAVSLATDVSGTLADARLSTNVALLNANQTFGGSNTFNGVAALTNLNNRFVGTFTGNGAGLTALNASNISTGTLADARHSTNVALLNTNQIFSGSNTFSGVASLTNVNNRFIGVFTGNGAGLSNITATATNSVVTMAGDIIGPSSNSLLARIRGANVSATPPVTGQVLRYNGTSWTPSPVALGTDVSGTLPVANGGTAASTAAGARISLGAAGSGANTDITSLSGLTTPLLATQGGSGLNTYSAGDLLYAPAANTLARRAIGTAGQVLGVTNGLPTWVAMNAHNHFGQVWSGAAQDGLLLQNTSTVAAASAMTAVSTATSGLGYGLFGQSASSAGVGVQGFAFATTGQSTGVQGESTSTDGTGVYGLGSASSGVPVGVYGEADSPTGVGVFGIGAATTGTPVGVYGTVSTVNGFGLYTPNKLFVGDTASFVGTVTAAVVNASSFIGSASNLTGISATGITVGTLADARLTANVALRNANQTFTGTNSFSPIAGPPFAVGNTNRVINLNADFVDGLSGTQFLRSDASSTQSVGNLSFAAGTKLLTDAGTAAAPGHAFVASPTSGMFSPGANILSLSTAGIERLRIAANGSVGLGRTPVANKLEVEGDASKTTAGGWNANSDRRIKTGIQTIEHALDTIERVHPVSFQYTEEYREAHPVIEDKRYCNVIAQEFAEVFPEAVKSSGEMLDGKPILQVDVHPAAIYAIAAIKELHELVKAKDDELAKLKEKNTALEGRLQALEKAISGLSR